MSQTTFLSDVLSGAPLSIGKLAYFRARLSNQLHEIVIKKFSELEKATGLTRAELARRIGRKPEQVTRWLGSPGNWTLETVSDLLTAMGCELDPRLEDLARYQDDQAMTHARSWLAAAQNHDEIVKLGVIRATDGPVTATFHEGQVVFLVGVTAPQASQFGAGPLLQHASIAALPGHEAALNYNGALNAIDNQSAPSEWMARAFNASQKNLTTTENRFRFTQGSEF